MWQIGLVAAWALSVGAAWGIGLATGRFATRILLKAAIHNQTSRGKGTNGMVKADYLLRLI